MLEVKRKPNENSPRGVATGTATARAHGENLADMQPELLPQTPSASTIMNRPVAIAPVLVPVPRDNQNYQTRTPVITGEIQYKGTVPVDGVLVGQLTASGGILSVRQKSNSFFAFQAELTGEISFKEMLRVNGCIAGTVYSKSGTLIIDNSAIVDANVEVAIAIISGTVHGDIVAHQRVELGPSAKIYGNIWTRSIAIKDGAIFDGVCTMIEEKRA